MKKTLLVAMTLGISVASISASAEPYSVWKKEHKHKGDNFTVHHASQEPLPYDHLVSETYYGKNPEVQMKIAASFEKGLNGVDQNIHEAANWYNVAAYNGSDEAAFKLYEYSKKVNGGKANDDGLYWLQQSAKQGNANALFYSAEKDFSIDNSKESLVSLRDMYKKAEKAGHPQARSRVITITKELDRRGRKEAWDGFWSDFAPSEY
mgnify:CR=1 FL=1